MNGSCSIRSIRAKGVGDKDPGIYAKIISCFFLIHVHYSEQ